MRNFFILEFFVLICLVFACSALYAEEVYHVEEDVVVKDDLVLIGKSCVMEGTVNGDAVIINGDMDLYGTVNGDAVIIGGNIGLYTGSRIKGDMVIIGGKYIKEDGAGDIVAGDVVTIPFGGLNHLFKLIPSVQVAAVEHGVELKDLGENQQIIGDKAEKGNKGIIEEGKEEIGEIKEKMEALKPKIPKIKLARKGNMGLLLPIVWGFSLSIIVMLFAVIFPSSAKTMTLYLEERPGRSFLTGFLAQILFVPAILFLILSIVGIALIPLFVLLYPISWLIGLVPCSLSAGKRITRDSSFFDNKAYLTSFIGLFILFILFFIAELLQINHSVFAALGTSIYVIALFTFYLYFTFGLGSLILSRLGTKKP